MDLDGDGLPRPFIDPHRPHKPLWVCLDDAQPWPCSSARLILKGRYPDDRRPLYVYLITCAGYAYHDLYRLNPAEAPDPRAHWERFVVWAIPKPVV